MIDIHAFHDELAALLVRCDVRAVAAGYKVGVPEPSSGRMEH
jgi:hypothetical protein